MRYSLFNAQLFPAVVVTTLTALVLDPSPVHSLAVRSSSWSGQRRQYVSTGQNLGFGNCGDESCYSMRLRRKDSHVSRDGPEASIQEPV